MSRNGIAAQTGPCQGWSGAVWQLVLLQTLLMALRLHCAEHCSRSRRIVIQMGTLLYIFLLIRFPLC